MNQQTSARKGAQFMTDLPIKDGTVPQARLAASVILLRDAPDGLEAFVQHRVSTMDFAAGMVVFPGGRVDSVDGSGWDYPEDLLQRHAADWSQSSIGSEPGEAARKAGTVLSAAIREVQEEAGLSINAADLRPWANWITPTDMPKRFDTYFYVAKPSPGAAPQHQTTEAWQSLWMPYYLLKEIAGFRTVDEVWRAEHNVVPVLAPIGSMAAFLKERENRR
jgi:8-oxo-dGTP pyrophosphatase MutT (NUDIX family)